MWQGATTDGTAKRQAGYPGDTFEFDVVPDPGCADADVRWSVDGNPSPGTGRRFKTSLAGGDHKVTATCGTATCAFAVTVCPIDRWLDRARLFYGPAIDFDKVRVVGSRLVRGPAGTGWTCNNVVRFKRPRQATDFPDESTLIHELGHVWEHQSGQAQLLMGLVEQTSRLFGRDPYDFGGPEGVRRGSRLATFKKEGQAEITRDYWLFKQNFGSDVRGVPFSTPGYPEDLQRLVEGAGIGTTPPRGHSPASAIDAVAARIVNAVVGLLG